MFLKMSVDPDVSVNCRGIFAILKNSVKVSWGSRMDLKGVSKLVAVDVKNPDCPIGLHRLLQSV